MVEALRHIDLSGPQILEASDAIEALDRFRSADVDVVFLDFVLPGGPGGLTILRQMLRIRPDARVVLLTGLPRESPAVSEGLSMGAFGFMPKPVRMDAIRAILESIDAEKGRRTRIH